MGSSGALGSVMTMPLELAATALSSRRRISSEACCPGSLSNVVREECAFNNRILQRYVPTSFASSPNGTDVKGSPHKGMYSEEKVRNLREESAKWPTSCHNYPTATTH